MIAAAPQLPFAALQPSFEGELYFDTSTEHAAQRMLYATDASVYQETPLAVAIPRTVEDIKRLVRFAKANKSAGAQASLIPRAAGTSLAGQVVGSGIVVDISTYFNQILELNPAERWVRVQPGVIRDDLNVALRPHGLQFGPETSTASRAMIGGMIGNNSCGLHSIVWGTTRDHLLEVRAVLADGAEVTFGHLSADEFAAKCRGENVVSPLEQRIYQQFQTWLGDPLVCQQIRDGYPNANVTRRNTGYALDALVEQGSGPGAGGGSKPLQLPFPPRLRAPSPLRLLTSPRLLQDRRGRSVYYGGEAKPAAPATGHVALVCAHFQTLRQSLEANLVALAHHCWASELVDDYILQLTKPTLSNFATGHS